MKFYLTIIATLFSLSLVYSQESIPFNSSRPGQAFTPLTVGKSSLQLQSGFRISETWTARNNRFSGLYFSNFINSNLFRYGISDKVEIRGGVSWLREYDKIFEVFGTPLASSHSWINFGSRILLMADDEKSQYLSFQQNLSVLLSQRSPLQDVESFELLLAYSRPMFSKTTLTANLSVDAFAIFDESHLNYVLNFSFPITRTLGGFVEHYATWFFDEILPSWDAGLSLMVTPNLQIDLSGGYGKVDTLVILGMQQWFVDTGVSWKIKNGASHSE